MNNISDRKIGVYPGTLINLIVDVSAGRYRIPQFQREFVWKISKIIELFDSIYQEYPIGSFFLWKAGREHNNLFKHSIDLNIPEVKEDDDVTFILDGQQRITSIYVVLKGLTISGTDYGRICFDLKEIKFTHRTPDNKRYIAVCDIWGPDAIDLMTEVDKEYREPFKQCYRTLQTYPISLVEVKDKELPAVCKIFQRINQSGKRLDRFDLISAMTFTKDFDLRERFKQDLLTRLDQSGFLDISPVIVTQLMALMKRGACTERHEFSLTSDDIKDIWDLAIQSVLLAADTLRKGMGVITSRYLPYDAILTLLAYYFAKSGNRSLPAKHMEWVHKWFWLSSFGQYYGSGGPTKMGRDRELFDKMIEGSTPDFNPPLSLRLKH